MAKLLKDSENDTLREKKKSPFIQQIFIKHCKEPGTGNAD